MRPSSSADCNLHRTSSVEWSAKRRPKLCRSFNCRPTSRRNEKRAAVLEAASSWSQDPATGSHTMTEALQRLIDKDEIRDLMARYCRGVDRGDWDLVRSTYHADAYDDHGDYKGGIDGFVDFARSRTGGATQVMHFLGECLIEFASADVAVAETYFFTAHTLGSEAQRQYGAENRGHAVQLSQYGRYVDRVERRQGVWRICGDAPRCLIHPILS